VVCIVSVTLPPVDNAAAITALVVLLIDAARRAVWIRPHMLEQFSFEPSLHIVLAVLNGR
jgi:hypothetical protein